MGCVPSTPGDPIRIQSRGLAVRRSLFLRAKTALCSWLLQVAMQHPFASIANTKDSEGRYQANCAVEARRVTGLASLTRLGLPKPPARPRATNSLRWIAARQGTKLNDSKGSVAPLRLDNKLPLERSLLRCYRSARPRHPLPWLRPACRCLDWVGAVASLRKTLRILQSAVLPGARHTARNCFSSRARRLSSSMR